MSKKKPNLYNPICLIEAIRKWPNPMIDKKHGYAIYVEGNKRNNQTREEHIVEYGHDLKARDIELVPKGILNYFDYRKDPVYKDTYNYYFNRKGKDKGFIKMSIQIDNHDPKHAWVKLCLLPIKSNKYIEL